MEKIKNEDIINIIIKDKKISLNNLFFCINCFENMNFKEITHHNNNHFILKLNDFKVDEEELDYNIKLNRLYEILKENQNKIIKNKNNNLIKYYKKLLLDLYEIIINDNSLEELYSSIIKINEEYIKYYKLGTFTDNYNNLFLLFCHTISQYAYLKAKELSFDEGNNYSFDDDLDKEDIIEKDIL